MVLRPDQAIAALAAPSEESVDQVLVAKRGLRAFVELAWPEIEPAPLVFTWHMDQICTHLEAVSRGDIRKLIINVPPGCSKSSLVSVLWPAWDWIEHPSRKWMFGTFDSNLVFRDALACRKLVRSQWFQDRWSDFVGIGTDVDEQETQSVYHTTRGGRRVSVTVGAGKGTGWHADVQVVDDPTKPRDVSGSPEVAQAALERAWVWWTQTMASRRVDPKTFRRVLIMQRLAEGDLAGRILENDREGEWVHLNFPMEFEPERRCTTKWGGDIRLFEGQLLCPERYDAKAVAEIKRDTTEQAYAAQYQQRPAPPAGNIFLREWFKERWTELPADLYLIQSWDCAFKDAKTADPVAGHVWGYKAGKFYLVDRIHDRMGLPGTAACVKTFWRRWPRALGKLIEDKANGPAVEQVLRHEVPGLIMVNPEGGKIARANAVSPLAKAGNIILPDPNAEVILNKGKPSEIRLTYEWVDKMLEELVTFPQARHDDDVDAMTQAVIYLYDHGAGRYLEAMKKIGTGEVTFGQR